MPTLTPVLAFAPIFALVFTLTSTPTPTFIFTLTLTPIPTLTPITF